METLVILICNVLTALIALLPSSPFVIMLNYIDEIPVLGVVNWFIPFDNCMVLLEVWIGAVVAYIVVHHMEKIIKMWTDIKNIFK